MSLEPSQERTKRLKEFYRSLAERPADGVTELEAEYLAADFTEYPTPGDDEPVNWDSEGLKNLRERLHSQVLSHRVTVMDDVAVSEWKLADRQAGVDLVQFTPQHKVLRHTGWIAKRERTRAKDALSGTKETPVASAILSAGEAIEAASEQHSSQALKGGWKLRLDAPRWSIADGGNDPPAILIVLGAFWLGLALAVIFGLPAELKDTGLESTTQAALAIGAWGVIALMAFVIWRGFSSWRNVSRMQLEVGRMPPPEPFVVFEERPAEGPGGQGGSSHEESEQGNTVDMPKGARPARAAVVPKPAPETSAPPPATLAREPIAVGSVLIAGGTLAAGLAGLGSSALGAIAAGGIAVVGLLGRQLVTPLNSPRDHQKRELKPVKDTTASSW